MSRLTDGDFIVLSQHDVVGGQVTVDDPLLLVQIPQGQTHLRRGGTFLFQGLRRCGEAGEEPDLDENVPDSVFGEPLPLLLQRIEMLSERRSLDQLHHHVKLLAF